jgi:hypothetical protein
MVAAQGELLAPLSVDRELPFVSVPACEGRVVRRRRALAFGYHMRLQARQVAGNLVPVAYIAYIFVQC